MHTFQQAHLKKQQKKHDIKLLQPKNKKIISLKNTTKQKYLFKKNQKNKNQKKIKTKNK